MMTWSGGQVVTDPRVLGVPDDVVADVQVEVAVVVEVGEGRRRRPVAVAGQTRSLRDVLESPVPAIAIQGIGSPPGHEEVGVAVVVVVADRHAVAVALGHAADPRGVRHVFERAVAAVAEQAVAPGWLSRIGGESAPLHEIDIEPAVAVVVDQADAASGELGELVDTRLAVLVDEREAGGPSVIAELGQGGIARLGVRRRSLRLRASVDAEDLGEGSPRRAATGSSPCRRAKAVRAAWSPGSRCAIQVRKPMASNRRPSVSANRASSGASSAKRF